MGTAFSRGRTMLMRRLRSLWGSSGSSGSVAARLKRAGQLQALELEREFASRLA